MKRFTSLLWVYIIVILAIFFIIKWKLPIFLGKLGERFVAGKLSKLDPNYYKILNDVLLPSAGNTATTQIDHVVISNYGVFCIETKYYKGWIFGSAKQEYWTQVIYRYKKKFYNPLRQNYAHIKALEAYIKPINQSAPITSFVAFPVADKLKISGTQNVGYARDIMNKIQAHTNPILSDEERDKIYASLSNARLSENVDVKNHNQEVRELLGK